MKIAMVAPIWERVPPARYGGIELVCSLLTEELVRRGHEVTLFASGDSVTDAELSYVYHIAQREHIGNLVIDLNHVSRAYLRAGEFDVIHNHAGYSGVVMAGLVDTPVLTTLHGIFTDVNKPLFQAFKDAVYYNSISDEQRRACPELNYVGTVYNAVDIDTFPFRETKDDYYLFIGRMSPLKGADLAAEVASRAGVRLVMAGKIDVTDEEYFKAKVDPLIDGEQIVFKGEVSRDEKRDLLAGAKGFIFPLQWSEPFGLVMVEAMVTGTPVIAFPYGSVPEIIDDGKTGFLVNNPDEMVETLPRLEELDPFECRRTVEARFGVGHMTDRYEELYETILARHSR
ncbi:MAG: glycosyltransferase family 4 protein [Actinobacteria bacterium]|nr:MAG: glycosyltransferase family 4 protein [Actinomycetota bacterium]